MVRSKVFYTSPEKLDKHLSRWLKKKKFNKDAIVSMVQSSHVDSPREMCAASKVILTVLYSEP